MPVLALFYSQLNENLQMLPKCFTIRSPGHDVEHVSTHDRITVIGQHMLVSFPCYLHV